MLEILQTPITVLHIVVALFVVLIVLLQPGKSGGIGAALGGAGAQQVFGGRGAGNFLSRLTWISAGIFFATSMMLAYVSSSTDDSLAKHSNTAVVKPVELPEGDEGATAGQPQTPEEEAAMEDTAGEAPAAGEELAAPEAADSDEKGSEAEGTDNDAPAEAEAKPADEKVAPTAPKTNPTTVKPQAAPQKPPAPKATPTTPAAPAQPGPATPPALPPASPAPPPAPAPAAPPGTP